jgi:hypothetical protein
VEGRPAGADDVSVTDFNVNNCFGFAEAGYKPPVGQQQFSKQSPDFIMTQDGTFLYAMGHLHDGGTNIQLGNSHTISQKLTPVASTDEQ